MRSVDDRTVERLVEEADFSILLDYGLARYNSGDGILTPDQRYAVVQLLEAVVIESRRLGRVQMIESSISTLKRGLDYLS